jgi:predicted small metal-binding protein
MATVYLISCRDAGVDCDFQARGSSMDEVMQLSVPITVSRNTT